MKIEVEGMDGLVFVDADEEHEFTAKIQTKPYSMEKIAKELGVQVRALNAWVKKEKLKCQSKCRK